MNKYFFLKQQEGIPEHDCQTIQVQNCIKCEHLYKHKELQEDCEYCIDEYADAQWDMAYDRNIEEMIERSIL